jgi:hypothetical protein
MSAEALRFGDTLSKGRDELFESSMSGNCCDASRWLSALPDSLLPWPPGCEPAMLLWLPGLWDVRVSGNLDGLARPVKVLGNKKRKSTEPLLFVRSF